ncbi:hypothetical protein C922_05514 [Plasmodium inui San Antonio 1]|uniref:Uncharacterized protein n=1 Tax=Plasmodium inui San Antonio 1 TaxID=1237626 RepID=W6ZT66_9APIC|nr:hypothetical protein C922_05514 [Plasmodium inui San Antonio 1]EUD64102.1 hypothetical protein C922_05514 [Plasmodium inui San Antonio 1]
MITELLIITKVSSSQDNTIEEKEQSRRTTREGNYKIRSMKESIKPYKAIDAEDY